MKRVWLISQVCLFLAGLTLALEYWAGLREFWTIFLVLLSLLWNWGQRRGLVILDSIFLVLYTLAAAVGILAGGPPILALLTLIAAISAWDLGHFYQRLRLVQDEADVNQMSKRHLARWAILASLSLVLPLVAYSIRFELSLGVAILIGFLAVLGLSRVVSFLSRESQ